MRVTFRDDCGHSRPTFIRYGSGRRGQWKDGEYFLLRIRAFNIDREGKGGLTGESGAAGIGSGNGRIKKKTGTEWMYTAYTLLWYTP